MSSNEDVVLVDSSVVPAKKKKSTLLRHWAIIDATGQRTLLELDKYAITRRVQISLRDLRILDRDSSCTIMGRERAIVLKLEYLKMIITAEEVLLLDSMDGDVIYLIEEFQRILHVENEVGSGQEGRKEFLDAENDADEENESPFEFRALEVALEAICSFLDKRTTALETAALHVMAALTSKISSRYLERIHEPKRMIYIPINSSRPKGKG